MEPQHHEAGPQKRQEFGIKFFKRFAKLTSWFFPSWRSVPVLLFILLLCLGLLEQFLINRIGFIPSKYYRILGDRDHGKFWEQTFISLGLILAEAFVKSTTTYVTSQLYVTWRGMVTTKLHSKYFRDILYYTINIMDKTVDNPDQRITQDVDKLCDTFSQIVAPIIISPFTIAYYIYKAQESSGYIGPVGVVIFFIIATVINKLLMSPVVAQVFIRERMEGNFRFKHMQMRVNCESAAFYRSGSIECVKTNHQLQHLIQTQERLIKREYALNFSINLFDYLGGIFSYIAISFPIFLGAYDYMTGPQLSSLISANAFVVIYLINCFTRLIDLSIKVTDMAGTTHRVVELIEVLGTLYDKQESPSTNSPKLSYASGWDDKLPLIDTDTFDLSVASGDRERAPINHIKAFTLSDVTYTPPKSSNILCKGLTMQFETGTNILITGDSGCGKSSLLRVVGGLWPEVRGSVEHLVDLRPHTLLFLPQKPCFTDGSLRQQILYPLLVRGSDPRMTGNNEVILRYLERVGLGALPPRTGGLDAPVDWNWYDELSPGEMQRLSFVRLFYHRPKFAVLDEATSQIGIQAEAEMYSMCREFNITLMSVGHRDSLRQFHDVDLRLDGSGGWSLTPITVNSYM